MENKPNEEPSSTSALSDAPSPAVDETKPLKLNVKRTCWIGVAFLGILLLWGIYNSYCNNFLVFMFAEKLYGIDKETLLLAENKDKFLDVTWISGIIMALDNIAALLLMPIFGNLSDKTHTKLGKRMPYIIVGTIVAAIALPFIPLFFTFSDSNLDGAITGVICSMVTVLTFMMMFRSPAVALMPDLTPKPLRSRANGIINLIGYIGGALPIVFTFFMPFDAYVKQSPKYPGAYHNPWWIETPFLVASVVMLIAIGLLYWKVKENKIAAEVAEDMKRGDALSETVDKVDDDAPMSKENKRSLILILIAEVLWFMAFNALETDLTNYVMFYLNSSQSQKGILDAVQGVAAAISFLIAGRVADKISRKWTIVIGLAVLTAAYLAFCFVGGVSATTNIDFSAKLPIILFVIFGVAGFGSSFIHNCSFPMVVDFCNSKKIGKFTSFYYTASMLAQSITPIVIGIIFKQTQAWRALPIYSCILMGLSLTVFLFVKAPKVTKGANKKGLEALGADD
jgi:maltose/moltooligosaccharide transporter